MRRRTGAAAHLRLVDHDDAPAAATPPAPRRGRWSDHDVEQFIGRLLQLGVTCAAIVVVLGAVMLLLDEGTRRADFHVFRLEATTLRSVHGVVRATLAGDTRAVVQLGLVLLIATPVARVALTLVAFLVQRDRLYVAITALVLALLLYGLVWGRA